VPYGRSDAVVRHIHTLFNMGVVTGLTDGQLLEQFACRRGDAAEVAFTALVERHGPMVLRACLGIVGNDHDAEDAFQATFLVLMRRGRTLWVEESLGPWLHRVACRAAARVKITAIQRRGMEQRAAEIAQNRNHSHARTHEDLNQALHEEVDQLPSHYRLPIVLCDLEGHSYEEAARHLGCPVGTVRSRLARGRERLRGRLVRRGLAPTAEVTGAAIASKATPMLVPPALLKSMIRAAVPGCEGGSATAGVVSASVSAIAEGVLRVMLWTKIKTMAALILAAVVSVAGLGLLALGANDKRPTGPDVAGQATVEATAAPSAARSKPTQARGDEATSRPKSPFQASEPILAIDDSTQTKVWVHNPETKTWHTYTGPKGVKVFQARPNLYHDFVALVVEGEPITEVAAFSVKPGKWVRQVLIEPTKKGLYPVTTNHVAAYFIGRQAYAFSSLTGKWSQQALNEPAPEELCHSGLGVQSAFPSLLAASGFIIYTTSRHAYAFSAQTGNWAVLAVEQGARARASHGTTGTALVSGGGRLYSFDPNTGDFQEIHAIED
jgi:RNA polymerase sigma factor (sigma-70 family)